METKPEPGAGDVEIEIVLDDKPQTLVPTWEVCDRISTLTGGITGAIGRIANLEFNTMVQIIQIGLRLNPQQAKMLPEAVYKTGLIALQAPLIRFCRIVANGGREPEEVEDAPEDPPLPA